MHRYERAAVTSGPSVGNPGAVRVAALQMSSGDSVDSNLALIDRLLGEAAAAGCDLVLLPENCAFVGAKDADKIAIAEDVGDGPIQAFLAEAAGRHGLTVVAGSIPLKSPEPSRCFGGSMAYGADGRRLGYYRKIHLFDVDLPDRDERYRESETMAQGDQPIVVDTPLGLLGLTICYDLRFPELYRRLAADGATAFAIPAAFTETTGQAHWHTLLRARAIENLAYVIAAGQHGRHPNGRTTFGHSLIVDPWGRVLAEQAQGDGLVMADLDPELPAYHRRKFPVLAHRSPVLAG